ACGSRGEKPHGTSPTAMVGGVSTSTTSGSTSGAAEPVRLTARRAAARPMWKQHEGVHIYSPVRIDSCRRSITRWY
ncbi:hypothetical protein, partial [Streptosporangium canum]|uniref:hypothetical protein n=1 Tax=Streptosporangium canum TaxID=324952 RepID=UPI001C43137D